MIGYRWLRAAARGVVGVLTMLPAMAMVAAILVDRGPGGEFRFSLFPMALLAFDPFAWTCARNSLIAASTVTALALIGGIAIGCALPSHPYRGRAILRAAISSMLAAPPACLALGLLGIWGMPEPWLSSPPLQAAVAGRLSLESWGGWPLWLLWIWSSGSGAVALVAIATARASERIEPTWRDAARLAGAGPFQVWRSVPWPVIRPAAARAASIIFPLALLEPGAPMILGLRRTLAFQIVEAAARPDPFPRIAVWTALAAAIALAGRWLLRWWGGRPLVVSEGIHPAHDDSRSPKMRHRAGMAATVASGLILSLGAAMGWLPILGLLRILAAPGINQTGPTGSAGSPLLQVLRRATDSPVPQVVANSLLLGLTVGLGVLILSALLRPDPGARLAPTLGSRVVGHFAMMSPMVQAVGILAMLALGEQILRLADRPPGSSGLFSRILRLGPELEVRRNPWEILIVAVGLSVGLRLLQSWRRAAERSPDERPSALDAALLAGASRFRARTLAAHRPARWSGAMVLAAALAAVNLVPALLFTPWMDDRTAAPAILVLAEGDREARLQAAALAVFVIAGNLAGLYASRLAPAPPPEWDEDPP